MSGVTSWYADLFQAGLEYVGSSLQTLSFISLAVGIIYLIWAEVEEKLGNIGNCQTPHTAAWIYKEACMRFADNKVEELQTRWADFSKRYPAATESMESSTQCNATD